MPRLRRLKSTLSFFWGLRKYRDFRVVYLNTFFYVWLLLFTPLAVLALVPAVLIIGIFSRRLALRRLRRSISWYGLAVIYGLAFPLIRVRYRNFGPDDGPGPFIFICNHRSASDPFLMGCLPFEAVQVANTWTFNIPILGRAARMAGYLSVNEISFADFSAKALRLLKDGVSIVAFPEGTRSGSSDMGQFHGSIFRIALESQCAIVPLCVVGNEKIPSRDFVLQPGKIKLYKLPALEWEVFKKMKPFELKNHVRAIIAARTAEMDQEAE